MQTVLVTGGSGLVGYAIKQISYKYNYNFVFVGSKDCDLIYFSEVANLFEKIKPDYVIHLAAKVGGLFKNMKYKVDMLEANLVINFNVLKCCHLFGVKKVVSCLSTCIFPDNINGSIKYPITESMLHLGPPHVSNDAYAYAKRLLDIHSRAYREQFGHNYVCIIPTNIYGPNDNYNLEDAHVVPALIHKCYIAKQNNAPLILAGTGKPLRQFIYSIDLAELIILVLENYDEEEPIILSTDEQDEISIMDVAKSVADNFGIMEDQIINDTSKADGQYKKTASNKKLRKYFTDFKFTPFKEGIKESVDWFIANYDTARK